MTEIVKEQCRAARALLGWSQDQLFRISKVSKRTIAAFEQGSVKPQARTLRDLRQAFEEHGVEFIASNGGGPGVRLKYPPLDTDKV